MLAISANVDEIVKTDTLNCGFAEVLTVPLKVNIIKDLIIPMLNNRNDNLYQKKKIMEMIESMDEIAKDGF